MSQTTVFRVADLSQNRPTSFDLRPEPEALKALAQEFGLEDLRKVRFHGEINAHGKRDWQLKATLGATIGQICVVTLDQMSTRVDTPVHRLFLRELQTPDEEEIEMQEDDSIEPLGPEIDLEALMAEALALEIPEFPRKKNAQLGEAVFAEPGITPMRDEDTRPFAGLSALKDALKSAAKE